MSKCRIYNLRSRQFPIAISAKMRKICTESRIFSQHDNYRIGRAREMERFMMTQPSKPPTPSELKFAGCIIMLAVIVLGAGLLVVAGLGWEENPEEARNLALRGALALGAVGFVLLVARFLQRHL